ncbi:MAG: exopolysaccharide Pel transporter PelG, partial [Pseudomonadota bacterium]|nr:exopolysaccharide Pel transporter PelG [Pseudomonadota bacterium]
SIIHQPAPRFKEAHMAGIGFTLRRLAAQDNLLGIVRAYGHAAVAAAGPWLFTIIALGFIYPVYYGHTKNTDLDNFCTIIMYNFSFALILSAPIYMVVTRYLADGIYRKNVTHAPTVLLQSLGLLYIALLPLTVWYYGYYVQMSVGLRLAAITNLFLVALIWILSIYMTALKSYNSITMAFITGMALAIVCVREIGIDSPLGGAGTLIGFNIGLAWIAFSLAGKIFAEYPYRLTRHTHLAPYFRRYWDLAVGGVCYNTGIWADKGVMWLCAPEASVLPSRMLHYHNYDNAMFLAYLTVVPALAVFIFSIETNFFLRFQRFSEDIRTNQPLSVIRVAHRRIIASLTDSARNFLVIQGTCSLVTILLAAKIFGLLHADYLGIGMFRLGVLGSFFQALAMFEIILLSYFDCRRATMFIQFIFLIGNVLFTLVDVRLGFSYYGYGYFLASLLMFIVASLVLFDHVMKLPYHAFITNNMSLKLSPRAAMRRKSGT